MPITFHPTAGFQNLLSRKQTFNYSRSVQVKKGMAHQLGSLYNRLV